MRFTDLRRSRLPVSEENERAEQLFPVLIQQSHLHVWKLGDLIHGGRRLLVGVATRSLYDMALLDVLDDFVREGCSGVDRIDVFESDRVERGNFERYLPGLGKVVATPIAGHWTDGILGDRGFGSRALRLVADFLDVSLQWNAAEWRFDVRG